MKIKSVGRIVVFGLLLTLLGGCAGKRAFNAGEELQSQGMMDDAVAKFSEAVDKSPANQDYRLSLIKAKREAALKHLEEGRRLTGERQFDQALAEFRLAQALDPSLEAAFQELTHTEGLAEAEKLIAEAEGFYRSRRFADAKNNLTKALELLPEDPRALELLEKIRRKHNTVVDGVELDVASDTPITLNLNATKLKQAFEILSRLSGINFIFDEELKEQDVSLSLEKASFAQALELMLRMNDLGKKVLNGKTIIVFNNSKEKNKQYEDYVIQTFYLSNIDAKKVVNLLRTMLQLRKVYVHEELNAIVVRDTLPVVKLAQQIIEAADRSDSEVVLDLELLEVSHNNELKIGPTLSTNSVSVGFSNGSSIVADALTAGTTTKTTDDDTTSGITTNLVHGLSNLQTFYTLPNVTYNLLRKLSDSNTLANPSIRVKNKEKAKVHIGTREPVITVTINGDQTSENIQYVDVGVKLDVEPNIQLDNTVVTKVNLEVSNATRLTALASGTTPLEISTTNASTVLVLKDGEQTVLGGLLRDDVSRGNSTIPFLGDIPLIGRLFGGHSNTKNKREILLAVTPHIVKNVEMPSAAVATIWSGGEDDLRVGPNFGSFAAFKPELEESPPAPAPALVPPGLPPKAEESPAVSNEAAAKDTAVAPAAADQVPAATTESAAPRGETSPALPEAEPITEDLVEDNVPAPAASVATSTGNAGENPALSPTGQTFVPPVLPSAANQAKLYFTGPSQAAVGQEIILEALVENVADLYSAPLFVRFDAQRLTFVRAEEGDFLKRGQQATLFTTSVNDGTGELIVGHKQGVGGAGVSGGGKLFRLVFKVRSAGPAEVGFDRINFRNLAGKRLDVLPTTFKLEIR